MFSSLICDLKNAKGLRSTTIKFLLKKKNCQGAERGLLSHTGTDVTSYACNAIHGIQFARRKYVRHCGVERV